MYVSKEINLYFHAFSYQKCITTSANKYDKADICPRNKSINIHCIFKNTNKNKESHGNSTKPHKPENTFKQRKKRKATKTKENQGYPRIPDKPENILKRIDIRKKAKKANNH